MNLPRTVYAIQHNVTKKIYIGSTKNVHTRYLNHLCRLRKGKHNIEDMQKDFNEYGEDYSLFILDEITRYSDRAKEYEWMRKYKTHIRGVGYNYQDRVFSTKGDKFPVVVPGALPAVVGAAEPTTVHVYRAELIGLIAECTDTDLMDLVLKIMSNP
jgi:hypothetical protein